MGRNKVEERDSKLLMIVGLYHPFVGGTEKECQKLSGKLFERGSAVTVLTQHSDGLPEYEEIDGIPVYRKIKGWHIFELTYMISVLHFLLKHRKDFDIIQCFGLYLFIPPAILVKYLLGKKVIARVEGAGRYGDFQRISKLKFGNLVLSSARMLDRIIAISRNIYQEIIEHNFSKHTIINIPNSVDVTIFQPSKNHENSKMEQIIFVGRLEAEKGLEYLIEAMKIVKTRREGAKLFIVGDGQLRTNLEQLRQKLELMNDVTFVGTANTVLPYYQEADVFVLPSLSEGFPLSLLEAMACKLPVIATAVSGSREIMDPHDEVGSIPTSQYHIGAHGILINPKDIEGLTRALLRSLKDRELSEHLGRAAQQYVKRTFSLDAVVDKYRALYATVR